MRRSVTSLEGNVIGTGIVKLGDAPTDGVTATPDEYCVPEPVTASQIAGHRDARGRARLAR